MIISTNTIPNLMDKSKRVYIKKDRRRMMTDSGSMLMPAGHSRKMFGKYRGGKYSERQG